MRHSPRRPLPLPLLLLVLCCPLLPCCTSVRATHESIAIDTVDSLFSFSLAPTNMVRLFHLPFLPHRVLTTTHRPLSTLPSPSRSPFLQTTSPPPSSRLPTVFVSHGGGPSFFMDDLPSRFADIGPNTPAFHSLRAVPHQLGVAAPHQPKAILVISAHWETSKEVHITSRDVYDGLLYDYSGFAPAAYELRYPAPGSSVLAKRVQQLLTADAIPAVLDGERRWDHGVFIPLLVMFPAADIPVVQVSLLSSLQPAQHLSIGRALAPLRDEGVLIVGSGFITHNFSPSGDARPFVAAVEASLEVEGEERWRRLVEWRKMPASRHAHAREEHLLPLHVVAGAAGEDRGTVLGSLWIMGGSWCSANYAFGEVKDVKAKASS